MSISKRAPYLEKSLIGMDSMLKFDGINDYISIPHNSNIDFEYTDNFSISFYVKFNSISVDLGGLVIKRDPTGTANGWGILNL